MINPSKIQMRYRNKALIRSFLDSISKTPTPSLKPWIGPIEIALRNNNMNFLNELYHASEKYLPKVAAFLQQLSEIGQFCINEEKFIAEIFAIPIIFAAEIDKQGDIETKFATPDLNPLSHIFVEWFDPNGKVILLNSLHTSEQIEQQGYNGILHLRETMTVGLLANKAGFSSPLPLSSIKHSGIPGENWHLRYLIGVLVRPLTNEFLQLPKIATYNDNKTSLWSKRLSIYLNMHLRANNTGYDVMPLIPNQLSYAIENGEASFCLLQMEHFAIARAKSMTAGNKFPIRATYHVEKKIIAITVGNTSKTIWDTTFPIWFIDENEIKQSILKIIKRCELSNFDFVDFNTYKNWRRTLEQAAKWLETL